MRFPVPGIGVRHLLQRGGCGLTARDRADRLPAPCFHAERGSMFICIYSSYCSPWVPVEALVATGRLTMEAPVQAVTEAFFFF